MKFDVVRAWKDETYRKSLSREEQATLPACPAGEFELTDADLAAVQGGGWEQRDCCDRHEESNTVISAFGSDCPSFMGRCTNVTISTSGGLLGLVTGKEACQLG